MFSTEKFSLQSQTTLLIKTLFKLAACKKLRVSNNRDSLVFIMRDVEQIASPAETDILEQNGIQCIRSEDESGGLAIPVHNMDYVLSSIHNKMNTSSDHYSSFFHFDWMQDDDEPSPMGEEWDYL